jgi:hypothetical protein
VKRRIFIQSQLKSRDIHTSVKKILNKSKMFKLMLICSIVGVALAQRGHYAGNSRPIVGSRYETNGNNNAQAPAQSNFGQQQGSAPAQQFSNNRFDDVQSNQGFGYQPQAFGFGQPFFGFQQPIGFAPNGFYGRRR